MKRLLAAWRLFQVQVFLDYGVKNQAGPLNLYLEVRLEPVLFALELGDYIFVPRYNHLSVSPFIAFAGYTPNIRKKWKFIGEKY